MSHLVTRKRHNEPIVLRRRVGEALGVWEDVRLTIIESNNYSALLSIDAPKSVRICKEEEEKPET